MAATTGWFVENVFNTKLTLCTCCTHTTLMQHNITMFGLHIHVILYRLQEPQRDSVLQEGTLSTMLVFVTYLLPELMSQKKQWKVVRVCLESTHTNTSNMFKWSPSPLEHIGTHTTTFTKINTYTWAHTQTHIFSGCTFHRFTTIIALEETRHWYITHTTEGHSPSTANSTRRNFTRR